MASSISKSRLRRAFDEGRRSAPVEVAENPYDNPKLQHLWERGRSQQRAGELKDPVPLLEPGETPAVRTPHYPQRAQPRRPFNRSRR